jgi:dimethylamine/trimethylamine dehydrogenase
VTLAEASDVLGGRAVREARLAGLAAWRRVADHRIYDLQQRGNVQMFLESRLTAEDVFELGIPNVFVATGASWRGDGVGRTSRRPFLNDGGQTIVTAEDIMDGLLPPEGPVVIYDDDQAYLAGVLAEHLAPHRDGMTFVTPAAVVSPFTNYTLEQARIQKSLIEKGIGIITGHSLSALSGGRCELRCIYTGAPHYIDCATLLPVTERKRHSALYEELRQAEHRGLETLELIGDAAMPGLIADAVYGGHMAARNFEADPVEVAGQFFRREIVALDNG